VTPEQKRYEAYRRLYLPDAIEATAHKLVMLRNEARRYGMPHIGGVQVILPWPDRRLFPNFKRANHWRKYRGAEQQAKADGARLTMATLMDTLSKARKAFADQKRIAYRVTFYPPDGRRRDDDGMIGAIKNYRDGICEALGFDDSRLVPEYLFAEPQKPGRVEIVIGEMA
jgi:crossover junction endodeoxyribonuclease RusA